MKASAVLMKFIALLLTFLLGFLSCIGVLVGGAYFAYTNLSLDTFKVDTEEYIDREAAEVDIPSMTVSGLVEEIKTLAALSDDAVTIDALVLRYGLILPEEVDSALPEYVRSLPLKQAFSEDGVTAILSNIYLGEFFQYDKTENENIADGDPKYTWYDAETGDEIIGLNKLLANYTLADFANGGINTTEIVEKLTIADVLDMTSRNDLSAYVMVDDQLQPVTLETPITVWFDRDGTQSETILSSLADKPINHVEAALHDMTISNVMGFVKYENQSYSWHVEENADLGQYILLTPTGGIAAELGDVSLDNIATGGLEEEIQNISVSTVLSYTKDENTGKWLDKDKNEVSGIMAVIADYKVGELDSEIGGIAMGDIAGFTVGDDGEWYEVYDPDNPSSNIPASGIMGALADLTVDKLTVENELSSRVEAISVADALGYTFDSNTQKWYNDGAEVTGVMSVIAGTPIKDIQSKVNTSEMGDVLGYTKATKIVKDESGNDVEVEWWYTTNSDGALQEVHPLMNAVAKSEFENLDELTGTLTIADLIPEDQRTTGFIALASPTTTLSQIPEEMNTVFNEKTFGDYLDCGAIEFENPDDEAKFRTQFEDKKLPELLEWVVDAMDIVDAVSDGSGSGS